MPEKVAEEVVKRDVKTIFDPATKELIRVIMPFMSKTEVMTLSVDRGRTYGALARAGPAMAIAKLALVGAPPFK